MFDYRNYDGPIMRMMLERWRSRFPQPTPTVNPQIPYQALIRPEYMQQQPTDSLAPMGLFQNYKQGGLLNFKGK